MCLIPKIRIVIFAAMLLAPAAWAADFTASLDNSTITLGESATLTLTFEGGQPQNLSPVPAIPNLSVQNNNRNWSQSFKMDMGSGQSSTSIIFTHPMILTPRTTGEFVIPALSADIDGQHFSSSPLKLTVLKADAPTSADINSGNEVAFMTLVVPSNKVYLGQQVEAQVRIYLRDDVENFSDFQYTSQDADGFLLGKGIQGGRSQEQVGNRVYSVVPITYVLTVTKTGPLTLGPFTASAIAVVVSQNQSGGDPFFRQFFNQGEQKQVSLATEPVKVEGLPLPEQNKPANFSGAIGNFTMNVSVGPTNVTVGDPVTVRVQISGRGSFDSVTLPDQSALNGFKIFSPTVKTEASDQLGMEGAKTFEEIVTPQNADIHEWPQFSFSFFNPDDGRYHTLTQPAVALAIHSAGTTPLPAFAKNAAPENQAPADISPIQENLGPLRAETAPLVAQPAFLALQSLPVLAFVAAFIWRKRVDNLANNPRLRRQRAVAQIVSSGLIDLQKFAAENKPDEFFATLFRLLQEQLGERLDCPASAITENVIDEHLVLRNAPTVTRDGLRELFQLCNQARYAPVRGTSELNSVAVQFQKVIGELQNLKT
jgi:hypothetical protein